jgi:hypothetical protein
MTWNCSSSDGIEWARGGALKPEVDEIESSRLECETQRAFLLNFVSGNENDFSERFP